MRCEKSKQNNSAKDGLALKEMPKSVNRMLFDKPPEQQNAWLSSK